MFRNDGGKRFQDVTTAGNFGHLQKGHGIAFGDVDNDGDQDVFEEMGGASSADQAYSALYENPGNANALARPRARGRAFQPQGRSAPASRSTLDDAERARAPSTARSAAAAASAPTRCARRSASATRCAWSPWRSSGRPLARPSASQGSSSNSDTKSAREPTWLDGWTTHVSLCPLSRGLLPSECCRATDGFDKRPGRPDRDSALSVPKPPRSSRTCRRAGSRGSARCPTASRS